MRILSSQALAALDSGRFASRTGFAVDMPTGTVAFWDDAYDLGYGGTTYLAAPGGFTVNPFPSAADLGVRSLDITMSGLDPDLVSAILDQPYHQRPITVTRFVMATDVPQVIHASQWFAGFIDVMPWRERPGGASELIARCEDIGRELGRKGARLRADADQRQIDATDAFFEHVVNSVNADLVWGRSATPAPQDQRRRRFFGIF